MNTFARGTRNYALPCRLEKQLAKQSQKYKEAAKSNSVHEEMRARARKIEQFVFASELAGVTMRELVNEFGTTEGSLLQIISRHCYNIYEERHRLYHVSFF